MVALFICHLHQVGTGGGRRRETEGWELRAADTSTASAGEFPTGQVTRTKAPEPRRTPGRTLDRGGPWPWARSSARARTAAQHPQGRAAVAFSSGFFFFGSNLQGRRLQPKCLARGHCPLRLPCTSGHVSPGGPGVGRGREEEQWGTHLVRGRWDRLRRVSVVGRQPALLVGGQRPEARLPPVTAPRGHATRTHAAALSHARVPNPRQGTCADDTRGSKLTTSGTSRSTQHFPLTCRCLRLRKPRGRRPVNVLMSPKPTQDATLGNLKDKPVRPLVQTERFL